MAQQAVSVGFEGADNRPYSVGKARLLKTPLSQTLLGERLQFDFYARNGFRMLSVPAWLNSDAIASRCQQFRNLARIDPDRARRLAIRTVSDLHLDSDAILTAVARLESPRHRFCAELFWPHIEEAEFAAVREVGRLDSAALLQHFKPDGRKGLARVLTTHLRAIANHCLAIESEIAHLDNGGGAPQRLWETAIAGWREVFESDDFWHYMSGRVEKLDDPRLRKEDVETARTDTPLLILGLHEMFVEKYAQQENYEECVRHLKLIGTSGFPEAIVRSSTWNAVKNVAGTRLENLCKRTKLAFDGKKARADRVTFESTMMPLLKEATEIRELLVDRLGIPDSLLEQSAFDDFAESVREATATKLTFDGDARERNILYSSLFVKRLLILPLSTTTRRMLEQSIQEDNRILYSPFGLDRGALPAAIHCYFVPGAEADPDKSILIPMHRIKERKVEVDRVRGTAGVSVSLEVRKVLVPRSIVAAGTHGKSAEVEVKPSEFTQEQREAASELASIKVKRSRSQRQLAEARDAEILSAEARGSEETRNKEEAAAPRVAAAKALIENLRVQEEQALVVEANALESSKRAIEGCHEHATQAARSAAEKALRRLGGLRGILCIEFPLAILFGLLFWLSFEFDVIEAVAAILSAVGIGKVFRSTTYKLASSRMRKAQSARDVEISKCREDSSARSRELREKFAVKRKEPQEIIDGVAKEISQIRNATQDRLLIIRKRWEKAIRESDEEFQQQTNPLRAKIVRLEPVKRETQAKEFPAYLAALARGFKDGEKPPNSDMQMTAAERSQVILTLRN